MRAMAEGPTYKVGDRVLARMSDNSKRAGTVIAAPKSARGKNYTIKFDGGYILNGRDCPQVMPESLISPAAK